MKTPGRKATEVVPAELQIQIAELESTQPDGKFPNRSALWRALEATAWAKSRSPRPLTGQVAMNLFNKNNLICATPVGQRGRSKGQGPVAAGGSRKQKTIPADIIAALKKTVPEKYHNVVDKAAAGSLKAKVKLKCLDCVAYQKKEIALCTLTDCGLWTVRPYKDKRSLTEAGRKTISLGMLEDNNGEDSE